MGYVSTTDYWLSRNLPELLIRALGERTTTEARPRRPGPWEMLPTAKPARPKVASPNRLDLGARPRYEVHVSHGTRAAIEREILESWHAFHFERYETGGFLYGTERARSQRAELVRATPPGPKTLYGRNSLQLQRPELVEGELPDYLEHLCRIGHWHTHPSDSSKPSQADLNCWANLMGPFSRHVALIVGPPWDFPTYTAWVTRPDYEPLPGRRLGASGKRLGTVTEPATVELHVL
jgi:integrative and conjugative element protein (TIGR02256 family)